MASTSTQQGLWTEDAPHIPIEELTAFVLTRRKPESRIYSALYTSTGQVVSVKVLTSQTASARQSFIHEAALLKLLDHKKLPKLLGITTIPSFFREVRESGKHPLAAIVTTLQQGEPLSTYTHSLEPTKKKMRKRQLYPYDKILDVLIEAAGILRYLHERTPAVVVREISIGSIMVNRENGTVETSIPDLLYSVLVADGTRVLDKLGAECLADDCPNTHELLSMDFFRNTGVFALYNPDKAPNRQPEQPWVNSVELDSKSKVSKGTKPAKRRKVSSRKGSVSSVKSRTKSVSSQAKSKSKSVSSKVSFDATTTCSTITKSPQEEIAAAADELDSMRSNIGHPPSMPAKKVKCVFHQKPNKTLPILQHNWSTAVDTITTRAKKRYDSAYDSIACVALKTVEDLHKSTEGSSASSKIPVAETHISDPQDETESETSFEEKKLRSSMDHLRKAIGSENLAAEILNGEEYGTPSDVYSFGQVIYSTLTRRAVIPVEGKPGVVQFAFTEDIPKEVRSLISACCQTRPGQRPNMREVQKTLKAIKEQFPNNFIPPKKHSKSFLRFRKQA